MRSHFLLTFTTENILQDVIVTISVCYQISLNYFVCKIDRTSNKRKIFKKPQLDLEVQNQGGGEEREKFEPKRNVWQIMNYLQISTVLTTQNGSQLQKTWY